MANQLALVTGASDGIGLEFCKLLAKRGYDLILVARREDKLEQIGAQLAAQQGINYNIISVDLSQPQAAQEIYQETQNRGLRVDLLINNAGLLHNGFFTQLDLTAQENMIRVNVLALTSMCHLFANDMAQRKAGSILNIASLAAWMPIPNQNVYAATKAYVLAFSQALHDEMRAADTGVTITALCPGYTATKMMNNPDQGGRLMISEGLLQSAEQVAEIGLNACLAGKSTVVPGLANRITAAFTHLFPKTFFAKWMGRFYRNNMR